VSHKYTGKQIDFIKNNCKGKTTYELTEMLNNQFNTDLTRNQVIACMKNRKITSDINRKLLSQFLKRKYTDEQSDFIRENITGTTRKDLVELFNTHFKLEISLSQMIGFIKNNHFKSGLDCRFKVGKISANKGMKAIYAERSKTCFKKGCIPYNQKSVGTEIVQEDGYTKVKIAEPNKWRFKQQLIWEKHNGIIPQGYTLVFGDRNRHNFDIDNLILVSKQQLLILNIKKLIQANADLTRTGVIIADLYQEISKRKRKLREGGL